MRCHISIILTNVSASYVLRLCTPRIVLEAIDQVDYADCTAEMFYYSGKKSTEYLFLVNEESLDCANALLHSIFREVKNDVCKAF